MLMAYLLFSLGLYFWTVKSIQYVNNGPQFTYVIGLIVLTVFVLVIYKIEGKKLSIGIIIAAVFMNLGLSISYRMAQDNKSLKLGLLTDGYTRDLIVMIAVYVVIYLIIRFTKIYKNVVIDKIIMSFIVVSIYGARFGTKTGGSYLYFAGIMIFAWTLILFPFVVSYLMVQEENRYIGNSVQTLPWNLTLMLLYTFVLYIGCVICNEFGLLLVLALTTTTLFFVRCKNILTKVLYTAVCSGGAAIACTKITHIAHRLQIWLEPSVAFGDDVLSVKAESVLYLFRHINQIGWYGNGIGSLPKSIYPTLNTDHVIVTLIHDYSMLIFLSVIMLSFIFVKWMMMYPARLCDYDRYLNLTCALIMGFIIIINVGSNLGSFITAGLGFPFISEGSSINAMLMGLMAIHCGLMRKRVSSYD